MLFYLHRFRKKSRSFQFGDKNVGEKYIIKNNINIHFKGFSFNNIVLRNGLKKGKKSKY